MLEIDISKMMITANGKQALTVKAKVENGELVCLFGPSGCGKTTLLKIISGLLKPDTGRIVYDNEVWFDSEQKINLSVQKRKIGFMFQDYALFPNMTVRKNIAYAQNISDNNEVEALMSEFGIEQLQRRYPHQLSGGQKQRVALARSLAAKPQLLLLDEPLSALDYEMRSELRSAIIKSHIHLGTTTLMVSHDIPEIMQLATQVMVLKGGKVVNMDKPNEVFKSHAHYHPPQ